MHSEATVRLDSHEAPAALGLPVSLSLLARLTSRELDALYRRAEAPASLRALNGAPRGRMLALSPLAPGFVFSALQGFAASRLFPWGGKSFASEDGVRGTGVNRALLLGEVFRFDTFVAASAVDGRPAVILDYDKPDNPWFIRQIHDELREVAKGLYLGPAMWKSQGGPSLVLHFAIDTTHLH